MMTKITKVSGTVCVGGKMTKLQVCVAKSHLTHTAAQQNNNAEGREALMDGHYHCCHGEDVSGCQLNVRRLSIV